MWLLDRKYISIISKQKLIIFLLLLFLLPINIYSGDFHISPGVISVGISNEDGFEDGYLLGHFLDFAYQSENGFGFDVSPLSIYWSMKDTSVLSSTFVNATVYYDLLKDGNFVLGPFSTIHMLGNNKPEYFRLQSGLLFSICLFDDDSVSYYDNINIINVELGYIFTNITSSFYAQIGIDVIVVAEILYGLIQEYDN